MNLNISLVGFFTFSLYFIIFGFFWRILSTKLHDTPVGKAMLFING